MALMWGGLGVQTCIHFQYKWYFDPPKNRSKVNICVQTWLLKLSLCVCVQNVTIWRCRLEIEGLQLRNLHRWQPLRRVHVTLLTWVLTSWSLIAVHWSQQCRHVHFLKSRMTFGGEDKWCLQGEISHALAEWTGVSVKGWGAAWSSVTPRALRAPADFSSLPSHSAGAGRQQALCLIPFKWF